MNQHPQTGGQAKRNNVDEARRGATRPAAVVAIVLCIGFAVAMVATWQFRKPRSHQEVQIQPTAAVQSETPKPETEIPKPEAIQTEIPEPEPVSRVWMPDSPARPISQASPAASQLMDAQVNSPTPVQEEQTHDFSHKLNGETVTFEAINPTTKVPGNMTAMVTGTFSGDRLGDGQSSDGSHLQTDQEATFTFVPNDRYSPSYSGRARRLQVAGDTTDDSIHFDFALTARASDGSSLRFTLREVATITEDGAQVTFQQVR